MKRVALLLMLSCGRVDIDIADPPKDFCGDDVDCAPGFVCDKGCDEPTGHCREKPSSCDDEMDMMPECGCDGVRYANECLRLQADAGFSPGPCP